MFTLFFSIYRDASICAENRHSWIVIVGTTRDYPTLQAFVDARCLKMVIKEEWGDSSRVSAGAKYVFNVQDAVEGELNNVVSLPT